MSLTNYMPIGMKKSANFTYKYTVNYFSMNLDSKLRCSKYINKNKGFKSNIIKVIWLIGRR